MRKTYRNLSEEEKEAKRENGKDRYRNMTEDNKQAKRVLKKLSGVKKLKYRFFVYYKDE